MFNEIIPELKKFITPQKLMFTQQTNLLLIEQRILERVYNKISITEYDKGHIINWKSNFSYEEKQLLKKFIAKSGW